MDANIETDAAAPSVALGRVARRLARLGALGAHSLRAYLRRTHASFRTLDDAQDAWRRWNRGARAEWEYYQGQLDERHCFIAGYLAGQKSRIDPPSDQTQRPHL
jgi:hypothetical protein